MEGGGKANLSVYDEAALCSGAFKYGALCVSVYDYMSVWVYGCMYWCMHGCMYVCVFVCMGV